ncbi:hypothetical protein GIB67_013095 [Kingdonia uniflora]|uniref:Replication termination factor 2 n=1 Tax=Kingdonia uniflora TaxID=39325 RepID=A0A7J7LXJ1_9MAGN|nr:hypothetical protein GIB67_013095 [Kingdonia uniflora]
MYASKKPDKVDPNETRLSQWTTCSLSFEPLKAPCVVDRLGNVFNKQPLVEAMLGKKMPKGFGHIKGLKDMIKIELSEIPGVSSDADISFDTRFQCPVSGLEFNGKYKFFALRSCGHVLSAKALKEVKSSSCLVCHQEFVESDKIVINGNDEEVMELREKIESERLKLREKKEKKMRNGGLGVSEKEGVCGMKHVLDEKPEEKGLLKIEAKGKMANGVVAVRGATNDSRKRFKSGVVAPPNATKEVYASIFTSSRKSDFKETYSCRSLPLGRN